MANDVRRGGFRYYLVLNVLDDLLPRYFDPDPDEVRRKVSEYLAKYFSGPPSLSSYSVVGTPSLDVRFANKGAAIKELVAAMSVQDDRWLGIIRKAMQENRKVFLGGGADLPISLTDHWCPREAADPIFANRAAAERLIGVPYLRDERRLTGKGVNVVIVDQGLDKDQLGSSYAGGWPVGGKYPGTTPGTDLETHRPSHGMMIARNVLSVVPEAKLYDLPVAPRKISDIPAFLHQADAAFRDMLCTIRQNRQLEDSEPWILVNPWGIHDTRSDLTSPNDYANNPKHVFNMLIVNAVSEGIDVVFAAGNCGQFCPHSQCGPTSYGPGRSIHGANSLSEVLTVGAVRADAMWLGYSSQGPGQSKLETEKPDLCAVSQFRETDDAHTVNTGTSAACALAAGVIAALRSQWPSSQELPPAKLNAILRKTARHPGSAYSKDRFGSGILDARAAFDKLKESEQVCLPS